LILKRLVVPIEGKAGGGILGVEPLEMVMAARILRGHQHLSMFLLFTWLPLVVVSLVFIPIFPTVEL
jgi:hypothetical protein